MANTFVPDLSRVINDWIRSQITRGIPNGAFCTEVEEPIPSYDDAPCETVMSGKNDTWIVFGRDRTSNFASGCGGKGMTQSGMIDIGAGRVATVQSARIRQGKTMFDRTQKVNPNFGADAARIYITQKCDDIDEAFGFKKTKGTSSKFKSAIGIKSDHTRIIARESVRIYAGKGRFTVPETCSNGEEISNATGRIEFIAGNGNEDELQPIVLGDKLKIFLEHQNDLLGQILRDIYGINEQLSEINVFMSALPAAGPKFALNVGKNIEEMTSKIRENFQLALDSYAYLNKAVIPGNESILSTTVFTT